MTTGPAGPNLSDTMKLTCPNCGGTFFQLSSDCVDSNAIPAWDGNYEAGGGTDTILFICQCGYEFSKIKTDWATAQ